MGTMTKTAEKKAALNAKKKARKIAKKNELEARLLTRATSSSSEDDNTELQEELAQRAGNASSTAVDPLVMPFDEFFNWAAKTVAEKGQTGVTEIHLVLKRRPPTCFSHQERGTLLAEMEQGLRFYHLANPPAPLQNSGITPTAKELLASTTAADDAREEEDTPLSTPVSSPKAKVVKKVSLAQGEKSGSTSAIAETPLALQATGLSTALRGGLDTTMGTTITHRTTVVPPTIHIGEIQHKPKALPEKYDAWTPEIITLFRDQCLFWLRTIDFSTPWQRLIPPAAVQRVTDILAYRSIEKQQAYPVSPTWVTDEDRDGDLL
jgi:hypothetical protein